MELAFVLLFVLLGTGAIVYAGMHRPAAKPTAVDDGQPVVATDPRPEAVGGDDGDGGGGD